MKAGKRWRLSLFGCGESLTNSISLYNPEVHIESIERHRDGRIGLANTGPSPSCSFKSPELLSYTSGASELRFGLPHLKAPEVWMATGGGAETDQMLQHSRFMRSKTFFLPLQTYTLFSWAAINRFVLIEEKTKNKKTKPENKTPPSRQHRKTQNDCTY